MPHPLSAYAATKLAGEYYCQVFNEVYKLPTVCLRYFNVYGPRQDANSQYATVIPKFIKRAYESNSPIIFGDGEQTRDFTFVKDAIQANIIGAESDASGVFNQPPRHGDIKHSLADISRARAIGYEPRYSLDSGLRETIRRLTSAS